MFLGKILKYFKKLNRKKANDKIFLETDEEINSISPSTYKPLSELLEIINLQ